MSVNRVVAGVMCLIYLGFATISFSIPDGFALGVVLVVASLFSLLLFAIGEKK